MVAGSSKQRKTQVKPPLVIAKESNLENTNIHSDITSPVVVDKGKAIAIEELSVDLTVGKSTTPLGHLKSAVDDDLGADVISPKVSEEDDNPDEDDTRFQKVISKRNLRSARGRGPLCDNHFYGY